MHTSIERALLPLALPLCLLRVMAYGAMGTAATATAATAPPASAVIGERFALYGQATYVEQQDSDFRSPYSSLNSLTPDSGRETVDATLYAGFRLWRDAELWVNPEVDQGFGLDNTVGMAGFASAEAYKVGRNQPYFRLARAFVRETWNLDGAPRPIEAGPNQLAGGTTSDRFVITLGKFSVVDVFDTNEYAHDPRADFLNWAVVDTGTFDYAADAWGYTVGAAGEWYTGRWTWRAGLFDLSDVPNSTRLEPGLHEFQMIGEIERRHEVFGQPGRILLTAYESRGRMGLLDEAVDFARKQGEPVDIAAVRGYRGRFGVGLSLEQQVSENAGVFARFGKAQGNVETYEFTDIDRTVAVGVSLKGARWNRPGDTFALALVDNGISATRTRFLDAGGLGVLVGDGRLPHPGAEGILESYYELAVVRRLQVTFDYQWVNHPAYNRDRGPVSIAAVRIHVQF